MCESYPTLRLGRLAQAVSKNGEPKVATYAQSLMILDAMQARAAEFDKAIRKSINVYAKQSGNAVIWHSARKEQMLRKAGRAPDTIAVQDFSDRLLTIAGFTGVLRGCVTVCTNDDVLGFPVRKGPVYSKILARFACDSDGDKPAVDLSATKIIGFLKVAEQVCNRAIDAIVPLYAKAFSKGIGEKVKIGLHQTMIASAVGTDDQAFPDFMADMNYGKGLTAEAKVNSVAQKLVDMAMAEEGAVRTGKLTRKQKHPFGSVVLFNGVNDYRGVFVGNVNSEEARFFGVTSFPMGLGEERVKELTAGKPELRAKQPAYLTTMSLVRTMARNF